MRLRNFSFRGGNNFLGLPDQSTDYKSAKAVILPVPYDSTTSYRSGTRDGPGAIFAASRNIELYDLEHGCEPLNQGVFSLCELEPRMEGPKSMVKQVEQVITALLEDNKFPVMLGGEHSLSLGAVQAMKKWYEGKFSVLQLDAHADLRETFEHTQFNHACVMRRILEIAPITQVGIRNISQPELEFLKDPNHKGIFWGHELQGQPQEWIPKILSTLSPQVYLTIDLDVFDPSIMPSVGTPEPGGLFWYPVISLIKSLVEKVEIIGFDIVELCPLPGLIAPDFLAAKLVFKVLANIFKKNNWVKTPG